MPRSTSDDRQEKGYETRDVAFQPCLWIAFGFSGTLILLLVGVLLFTKTLTKPGTVFGRVGHPPDKSLTAFPHPQLQTEPAADLQNYVAGKQRELSTYGWVDQRSGTVRIPIDRAVDLLVNRGLPIRPPDSGLTELDMQAQKTGAQKTIPPKASQERNP